jgi:hypothetical protein
MSEFALKTSLPGYLQKEQARIEKFAVEVGLDFFPTIFEAVAVGTTGTFLVAPRADPDVQNSRIRLLGEWVR